MCLLKIKPSGGFPGGPVVKSVPCNAGDTGLIPGPGRSHVPGSNEPHAPHLQSVSLRARPRAGYCGFLPDAAGAQQLCGQMEHPGLLSQTPKPSTVCKKANFPLQSTSILRSDTDGRAGAGAGVAGGVSGQDGGQVPTSSRDMPVLRILLSLPAASLATPCRDDWTGRTHQASES